MVPREYIGKADGPVRWDALVRIFDAIWGPGNHELGGYPRRVGPITVAREDGRAARHTIDRLEELQGPYGREETARIEFVSFAPDLTVSLHYFPAQALVAFRLQAPTEETADRLVGVVRQEFPLSARYVFVSYVAEDLPVAEFVKTLIQARVDKSVAVFVANRDVAFGSAGTPAIREQLENAVLLVAISPRSRHSPWVSSEAGAVWGRGQLVLPIFLGISANEFNGPIKEYCQGCNFRPDEIRRLLRDIVDRVCPGRACPDLSPDEEQQIERLQENRH